MSDEKQLEETGWKLIKPIIAAERAAQKESNRQWGIKLEQLLKEWRATENKDDLTRIYLHIRSGLCKEKADAMFCKWASRGFH